MTIQELQNALRAAVADPTVGVDVVAAVEINGWAETAEYQRFMRSPRVHESVHVEGDPSDGRTLFTGLHEIGHIKTPETSCIEGRGYLRTTAAVILDESDAWKWAIEYARDAGIAIDADTWRWAFGPETAFGTYLWNFTMRCKIEIARMKGETFELPS